MTSKSEKGANIQEIWDRQSRLVTIESWLTINGRIREAYTRQELIFLIDEFEQLVHGEQKRLNDYLTQLVHDYNNVRLPGSIFSDSMVADIQKKYYERVKPVLPWKTRLWNAISRRFNASKGRH